ncbi:MAG: PKD domain-containing protein [Balneolaceae bacterium]|nr:PKD domain-containing protein [Balneolaceae bacterium]
MGKLNSIILWMVPVAVLLVMVACEPQTSSGPSLDDPPISENVTFDLEHDADNPNVVHFTSTSDGFKFLWDLGNGQSDEGTTVTGEYPLKGEYTVQLTIFTESGQAMNQKTVTIEETNALMLDDPDLNLLTGGAKQVDGKTWVVDSTQMGHMGVGPVSSFTPEWWAAAPNSKPGTGLYNDEYTFKLDGLRFEMETNGDVFINQNNAGDFPGAVDGPGGDKMAPWTAPEDISFNLNTRDDGSMFLTISDPGFIGFNMGVHTYQILELTENQMFIRFEDSNDDLVWYHCLIPKGYTHPPVELPYKSEHLEDNFDDDGNVTWITDQVAGFKENYDNPAPLGINLSDQVAQYKKGESQWENVYLDLGYDLNLNERSTIRLKVFLSGYNDYETVDPNAPDWAPNKSLAKQVAVKLHDSQIAQPFTSQAQVIRTVEETDKWVQLEFDFSAYVERKDFDRIVIQIGGEGHYLPGIFFIDDFEFVE